MASPCEHGNEPSDSIKVGEFLDHLSDYYSQEEPCFMELVGVVHIFLNSCFH
jgi:hypothetical protein